MIEESTKSWEETFDKTWRAGDLTWAVDGGMISPIVMPHQQKVVDPVEVRKILKESKALFAIWTTEWDSEPTEWWWTCCDIPGYDLDKIENSRGKRGVKSGLKNCEIRSVEPEQFAEDAYPVYIESLESYGFDKSALPDLASYSKTILKKATYEGTRYWGAYAEGKLVAFSTCFNVGGGVSLGSTKSLKAFQNLNVNSALFFEICRYYLNEGQALYVSNGRRNLLHPTSINDFLERMGFRKIYGKLNLELSPLALWIHRSGVSVWGKWIFLNRLKPSLWEKIEGFSKLMEIHKSFQKK
jgi:hypothetical protein